MGTGGGEFLFLLQPLPDNSYATEGYEPNLPLAKERLEPLGVNVVKVEKNNKLNFANYFFDLVINRHEDFPNLRFYDIGAVIYYLKAVPWQISDFTVKK